MPFCPFFTIPYSVPLTDLLSVTYRDFGDGDGVVDLEAEVAGDLRDEPGAVGRVADEGVIDGRTRGRREARREGRQCRDRRQCREDVSHDVCLLWSDEIVFQTLQRPM